MGTQTTFSVPEKTALVQFEVCPKIITRVAFFFEKVSRSTALSFKKKKQ
jgi:hypothetical protein